MRPSKLLTSGACTIAVIVVSSGLRAAPTEADVGQARAECHRHKVQVQERGSFATVQQIRAWESACARASRMMDELAGESPRVPVAQQQPEAEAAAVEAEPDAKPEEQTTE